MCAGAPRLLAANRRAHNSCFRSLAYRKNGHKPFTEALAMSSMQSLEDLMQDELKDIYDAEKQLTKALPKLAKKASNEELRDALQTHLQETEGHIERLEQSANEGEDEEEEATASRGRRSAPRGSARQVAADRGGRAASRSRSR